MHSLGSYGHDVPLQESGEVVTGATKVFNLERDRWPVEVVLQTRLE